MKNIIYDGLNVFFALQGEGKSYVCTFKGAMEILNPKSDKIVLSNYPIIVKVPFTFKQKLTNFILKLYKSNSHIFKIGKKEIKLEIQIQEVRSSYVWDEKYTSREYYIHNALVIIDEGNTRYSGAYAWEMTKEDRLFFQTLRHNLITVFMMMQSFEDLHPFLRRKLTYIHEVYKRKYFWKKIPSWFRIETYTSIKNYMRKDDYKIHKKAKKTLFNTEKIPFLQFIGNAYETHYFKNVHGIEPKYIKWSDKEQIDEPIRREEPVIIETVSDKVLNDTVATLMRINKWKRKDARLEVNKIILEYNASDINTVDKMLRIALQRRREVLEDTKEEQEDINDEDRF